MQRLLALALGLFALGLFAFACPTVLSWRIVEQRPSRERDHQPA